MGSSRTHRFTHWAALALLAGASGAIVRTALTGRDGGLSRAAYEANHRACERLNAQVVRLRLDLLHGGGGPADHERLDRLNAEWLSLYKQCRAWEYAHGERTPGATEEVEAPEATAATPDGDDGGESADG